MGRTISIHTDIGIDTDDILDELSDDELREELDKRGVGAGVNHDVVEIDKMKMSYDREALKRPLCDLLDLPYTADNEAIMSKLQSCLS